MLLLPPQQPHSIALRAQPRLREAEIAALLGWIFEFDPPIPPDLAAELDLPELIDPPGRAAGFGLPGRAAELDRAELSDKAAEHSGMVAGPVPPDRAAPPDMPGSAVVPVLPVQAQTASDLPETKAAAIQSKRIRARTIKIPTTAACGPSA